MAFSVASASFFYSVLGYPSSSSSSSSPPPRFFHGDNYKFRRLFHTKGPHFLLTPLHERKGNFTTFPCAAADESNSSGEISSLVDVMGRLQLKLLTMKLHLSSVIEESIYRTWGGSHSAILDVTLEWLSSKNANWLCLDCSTANIRSEVLSPFRSVRMFFYLAFIASGAIGGLIATTRLISAIINSSRAADVPGISKDLAIDLGAVSLFAFLYSRENNAKNAQVARLTREETLSRLKLRVDEDKIISVGALRGFARLVICAGPKSYIMESFRLSEPFMDGLLERGVLVAPFATDGQLLSFEFEEGDETNSLTTKRRRLWQLSPVYISEWTEWLEEQKKLAGISSESPVYLSLRLDGRVRGSGVGYPPWNALVAQLPPVKGMWTGLLDGFDGRV